MIVMGFIAKFDSSEVRGELIDFPNKELSAFRLEWICNNFMLVFTIWATYSRKEGQTIPVKWSGNKYLNNINVEHAKIQVNINIPCNNSEQLNIRFEYEHSIWNCSGSTNFIETPNVKKPKSSLPVGPFHPNLKGEMGEDGIRLE